MATILIPGQRRWSMTRDNEGHREYKITHLIMSDTSDDGPAVALQTAGLPVPGAIWQFDNDLDIWAQCKFDATVTPIVNDEPNYFFEVEQTFSTKPDKKCQDDNIEDPLLEPQKVSGSFTTYQEEATIDRFGFPIQTSSHEIIRGPQVEFDANRPTVKIEQNVALLNLSLCSSMIDKLNDSYLWGLPARCVKLSRFSWERKYYGSCGVYYTRSFEFDIRYEGFDKFVLDEGTKVLNGHRDNSTGDWILDNIGGSPPNPSNPFHFVRYQDKDGNLTRVILDGEGKPFTTLESTNHLECSDCPGGAPDTYVLYGIRINNADVELELTHIGGCNYESVGARFSLHVSAGLFVLDDLDLDRYWVRDVSDWACLGSNSLELAGGDGPMNVVIAPQSLVAPGSIYVSKYNEANFLLLGIPTIL